VLVEGEEVVVLNSFHLKDALRQLGFFWDQQVCLSLCVCVCLSVSVSGSVSMSMSMSVYVSVS